MRRVLALLCVLTLLCGLVACDFSDGAAASSSTAESSDSGFREIFDDEEFIVSETTLSREDYLAQRRIPITGSEEDEKSWIYQLGSGGVYVREATIEGVRGGEPVEIVQISDLHYNLVNDRDLAENNPSVMSTYAQREWLADGASRRNAEKCLKYGSYFDQMVLTGDTLDYMSWGALELLKETVWDPYPDTLVALGNHDSVRVMGLSEDVKDPTSREERYALLQQQWKHDVYYASRLVKDKVLVVQMDNSQNCFWDSQVPQLKADIDKARENGYTVLLFMHAPLNTANPEEVRVPEIARSPSGGCNFFTGCLGGAKSDGATREVWELIMHNADVIRGVFAGHIHGNYYAEMLAQMPSGESRVIPQYVLKSAAYMMGQVLKITVI